MPQRTQPRHILIVRPSALGDVCRTVPVLVSLRHACPDARIDWVVQDSFVEAIAGHPALDEAIPFPRRRFARWWRDPAAAAAMVAWARDLRRRRYDLVLDCQGLGRSGLIAFLTGARRRIGHRDAREAAWLGYTVRHAAPAGAHTVDRMLSLLEAEGIPLVRDMRLHVAPADAAWWDDHRAAEGLEGPYAVLAPTSRWSSKRWPAARFDALRGPLVERGFGRVVVVGAPDEREQVAALLAAAGDDGTVVDLVGRLSIGRLLAAIAGAGVVVGNDSAPLHMAVGLDVPCVALFGPTDPDLVGPYRRPESVVRPAPPTPEDRVHFKDRRLGDSLMRAIEVEQVVERVDAVLARPRRPVAEEAAP
jgi:lipopolysaccharide heptosyltransferase I